MKQNNQNDDPNELLRTILISFVTSAVISVVILIASQ